MTSVPVLPIEMPMSASFTAGASFTPSPVIATICPFERKARTIRSLSAGETLAKTEIFSIRADNSSSESFASSAPVIASFFSIKPAMPACFATARAVFGWSPVIITVFMPAFLQSRIAFFASSRGGSIIPASPKNTIPPSISATFTLRFFAKARTLKAEFEKLSLTASISSFCFLVSGISPPSVKIWEHFCKTASGAPFVKAIVSLVGSFAKTVIIRVSLSNGISFTRRYFDESFSFVIPPFAAATRSAVSVGSPSVCHSPSDEIFPRSLVEMSFSVLISPLLQMTEQAKNSSRAFSLLGFTDLFPSLISPAILYPLPYIS